jgi:hypothetical protein
MGVLLAVLTMVLIVLIGDALERRHGRSHS